MVPREWKHRQLRSRYAGEGGHQGGKPTKKIGSPREEQIRIVKMLFYHMCPSPTLDAPIYPSSDKDKKREGVTLAEDYSKSHVITPSHAKRMHNAVYRLCGGVR